MTDKKITNEAVVMIVHAATILQMDASGMSIPSKTNIFGEIEDHAEQVRMAKIAITRIANAYCRD